MKQSITKRLDGRDAMIALGLFAFTTLWAFVWSEAFPEHFIWPELGSALGVRAEAEFTSGIWTLGVGFLAKLLGARWAIAALAVAGRIALGLFAAMAYFAVRRAWFLMSVEDERSEEPFFHTRFAPLCTAVAITCSLTLWRNGQYASSDFVYVFLLAFAALLWTGGRARQSMIRYAFAYLVVGLVAGENPLAVVALLAMAIADSVTRRRLAVEWRGDVAGKGYLADRRERFAATICAVIGFIAGMLVAITAGAAYSDLGGSAATPEGWLWWFGNLWNAVTVTVTKEGFAMVALAPVIVAVCAHFGFVLRRMGEPLGWARTMLSIALGIAAITSLVLSTDASERAALAAIGEYSRFVADSSKGTDYLFTDGLLDDAIRIGMAVRKSATEPISVLKPPTKAGSRRLASLAPTPGDAAVFAEGGADIFRAWLPEVKERAERSSWQLGGHMLERRHFITQRTCGAVMRAVVQEADAEEFAKMDARAIGFSRDALSTETRVRSKFSWTSEKTSELFDALLWRLARMADARRKQAEKSGEGAAVRDNRLLAGALDEANLLLLRSAREFEQIMPSANLVLTPREGLDIALKRADFSLARRYAVDVLRTNPGDTSAHFACAMDDLAAEQFKSAIVHFEAILKVTPNEPAVLNNIALSYYRMGDGEKAMEFAEKAAKYAPDAPEVQKLIELIREKKPSR